MVDAMKPIVPGIDWIQTIYNFVTSKTIQTSTIISVLGFFWPPAAVAIAAHPELATAAVTLVFGVLRMVTKDSVIVKK